MSLGKEHVPVVESLAQVHNAEAQPLVLKYRGKEALGSYTLSTRLVHSILGNTDEAKVALTNRKTYTWAGS